MHMCALARRKKKREREREREREDVCVADLQAGRACHIIHPRPLLLIHTLDYIYIYM